MSTLYIVATPIGNLDDISTRALDTLRSVELVICEDTRYTQKILSHFDIHTSTDSLHAHSKDRKIKRIIKRLKEGSDIAYVTDAGTPAISDPGSRLVASAREARADVAIVPIPGPSAVTAALSVSGLPASRFFFLGFLPRKKGRGRLFEEIALSERTVVFFASPHRIIRTLTTLADMLDPDRMVVVTRELTKIHEEVISGSAQEVLSYYEDNSDKQRGEFVVMVEGK